MNAVSSMHDETNNGFPFLEAAQKFLEGIKAGRLAKSACEDICYLTGKASMNLDTVSPHRNMYKTIQYETLMMQGLKRCILVSRNTQKQLAGCSNLFHCDSTSHICFKTDLSSFLHSFKTFHAPMIVIATYCWPPVSAVHQSFDVLWCETLGSKNRSLQRLLTLSFLRLRQAPSRA